MGDIKLKPSLRFPEFIENWEETKFNNHFEFKNTNSLSRENLNYESGKVKNIHYGDIHTKFSTHLDIEKEELPFINEDVNISRIDEGNYVLDGDLVMADASEDYADIGKTIEVTNTNNEKILAGLHTFLARKTNESLVLGFFGHLLTTFNARLELMRIAQGTKVLGLSKGRVEQIPLIIPKPAEQEKITNFLTLIHNRISLLNEKKGALVDFKKGVMQKLFNQDIRFKDDNEDDFPDWEEKKAHKIFKNHTNKKHKGDLRILSASQKEGMIYRDDSGKNIQASIKSVKSYKIVEPNDFVITLRSFQGGIDFSDKKGICSPAYIILKNRLPIGIRDGKQITYDNFGNMLIPYPNKEEQTKIANYLTDLDSKIDGLQQKIEANVDFKKGVLQKMFV
jgi:type I restriction enzyme S subunit